MNSKILYIALPLVGLAGGVILSQAYNWYSKPSTNFQGERQGTGYGQRQKQVDDSQNSQRMMQRGGSKESCISDECLAIDSLNYPVGELGAEQIEALNKALDDEYKAFATYDAVIKKLGNVRPFIMIIRAEEQHISSLKSLFDKYGLKYQENPYLGKVTSPETLTQACATGVEAEKSNVALYESNLLPKVKDYKDITWVFTNLMNASKTKHLPAFTRCSN